MSLPQPLNQAVIVQALFDLRNGQLRRCRTMGFAEDVLEALKNPTLLSMLTNASVSWCSVSVDYAVLARLLEQAHALEAEVTAVDRMLRLEASTEMVSHFYGLTNQEVALRREMLGLTGRKGRHPILEEQQDVELWHRWKTLTGERNLDMTNETAMLPAAMDLADNMALPLAVVWASIKNWQNIETETYRGHNNILRANCAE